MHTHNIDAFRIPVVYVDPNPNNPMQWDHKHLYFSRILLREIDLLHPKCTESNFNQ